MRNIFARKPQASSYQHPEVASERALLGVKGRIVLAQRANANTPHHLSYFDFILRRPVADCFRIDGLIPIRVEVDPSKEGEGLCPLAFLRRVSLDTDWYYSVEYLLLRLPTM